MWEEPGAATLGQIPRSVRLGRTPEWELLRAGPRYRRGSSRFTYGAELSPDAELGDERAIALDVGVPQVVQQTPLLADQEKKAAARVVVLGVRLQVLGELPDPCGVKRDLDLGRSRVLVCAPVVRDQLAFDFVLDCQTRWPVYGGACPGRFRRQHARGVFDANMPVSPDYPGLASTSSPDSPDYPTCSTEPSERGSAPGRQALSPSITIACPWPNEGC